MTAPNLTDPQVVVSVASLFFVLYVFIFSDPQVISSSDDKNCELLTNVGVLLALPSVSMEEVASDGDLLVGASNQKRNALSRLVRKLQASRRIMSSWVYERYAGCVYGPLSRSRLHPVPPTHPPTPTPTLPPLLQSTAASPTFLTITGALLLAVGTALIAMPVALGVSSSGSSSYVAPVPAPPAVNSEGVPLGATAMPLSGKDGCLDCRMALSNLSAYLEAAMSAEVALFGAPASAMLATNASTQELRSQLGAQPSLLMGTVFWVLVSASAGGRYTWSDVLPDAVAVQLDWANSALAGAGTGLALRLDALVAVPAPDAAIEGCGDPSTWAALDAALAPDARRLHFLVCEPAGVNGASVAVLGDVVRPAGTPRTTLLRRSALLFSRSSVVHQLGHVLGLAHPFSDHPTCKYDADGILDTPAQACGSWGPGSK